MSRKELLAEIAAYTEASETLEASAVNESDPVTKRVFRQVAATLQHEADDEGRAMSEQPIDAELMLAPGSYSKGYRYGVVVRIAWEPCPEPRYGVFLTVPAKEVPTQQRALAWAACLGQAHLWHMETAHRFDAGCQHLHRVAGATQERLWTEKASEFGARP